MSQNTECLPVVQVLTTGGTIAGAATSSVSASYQSAALHGEALMASVPGVAQLASLRVTDVLAKDSADMNWSDWCGILDAVKQALNDPDVAAVVVTHGTDTLEETAFFLDAVLRSDKPVVLVGAMRPATALSADGPLNLFNAIAVAIDDQSIGRGVLVVMNDTIMTARAVAKSHSTAVQAFTSPQCGAWSAGIGRVYMGSVCYHEKVIQRYSQRPVPFAGWMDLPLDCAAPRVDILYGHAGMSSPAMDTASLPDGYVLAGVGAGNFPSELKRFILGCRSQGVVVVRSTRVWSGGVVADYQGLDTTLDLVSAADLSPHKARILLMLALRFSREVQQIRQCFESAVSDSA